MGMLPLNLEMAGRQVLIVGGGRVAQRKAQQLLMADATLVIVSPQLTDRLEELVSAGLVEVWRRTFQPSDLEGFFMAIAATNDRLVNQLVATAARGAGVMVSVADDPSRSDLHFPAVLRRGDLLIALSTGGRVPALAAWIRNDLEKRYGPAYAEVVATLALTREKLLTAGKGEFYNKELFLTLLDRGLPEMVARGDNAAVEKLLAEVQSECEAKDHPDAEDEYQW
ncbi:MAG TPA: bifunctional precorrin-2 dehydrogenase/sirohydrochlorin ferrochelatase [Geobacterales bacterium]|nr:bifunctional precorrin-2 dehydrogenase/sirohydrochlorin ferrochelatase [Geobacterales bacterium]